jgi:hypothetical protein
MRFIVFRKILLMVFRSLITLLGFLAFFDLQAQNVAINNDNSVADASAALDVKSSSKGMLVPRMTTTQMNAIVSPAIGLVVYNTDSSSYNIYTGAVWFKMLTSADSYWSKNGSSLYNTSNNIAIGASSGTAKLYVNQPSATDDAGSFNSSGTGTALKGYNNGSGRAADFEVPISTSTSTAVNITNAGSGEGLTAYNSGIGKAAYFQINSTGNSSNALESLTYGTGRAGSFTISNNASSASGLEATTNGTGWAGAFYGSALIRGKGTTNSTQTLRLENSSGTSLMRVFDNGSVALNTFSSLNYGGYSSVGTLANKKGLTIASASTYTADAPAVLELMGSAASVGEELGMIDFIHQSSNSSVYNVARITAVRENSNPTFTGLAFYTRQFATLSENMRISNAGNVGIGCTSPQYKLHVVGDIAAQGGTLRASSVSVSTVITACSDLRFKRDIHPMTNVLHSLLQIQGVKYYFRSKEFANRFFPETEQIGFIAQDVEKFFPQVVVTEKDGYKGIDYTRFAPLLLESIKEQQKQIEEQHKLIEQLKGESAAVKEQMEFLKGENKRIAADVEKIKAQLRLFSSNN